MADVLAQRRREQQELLARACDYVERLSRRVPVAAAAVVGSVARGDFNVWSDVDVVVVVEDLPARAPDRAAMLIEDTPAGVQPVGFTPAELAAARARGNPLVREADEAGVILRGGELLGAARR